MLRKFCLEEALCLLKLLHLLLTTSYTHGDTTTGMKKDNLSYNYRGSLGTGLSGHKFTPTPVKQDGVLAGKVICDISAYLSHIVVSSSDSTLFAWGENTQVLLYMFNNG